MKIETEGNYTMNRHQKRRRAKRDGEVSQGEIYFMKFKFACQKRTDINVTLSYLQKQQMGRSINIPYPKEHFYYPYVYVIRLTVCLINNMFCFPSLCLQVP